jgi:hypothetical protein
VRTACGTAYNGVLLALDTYLMLKDVELPKKKKRRSIEFYEQNISKIDEKLLNYVDTAYNVLQMYACEDSRYPNTSVINEGFDVAYEIINKIKPQSPGI